jgi:hypothetical protein
VQVLKEKNQPAHEKLKYVLYRLFLLRMLTSFVDKSKERSERKKESGIG